jgi:hypothetical protein
METDPVSETFYSLEYWKMDKVQKPSNPEIYSSALNNLGRSTNIVFIAINVFLLLFLLLLLVG